MKHILIYLFIIFMSLKLSYAHEKLTHQWLTIEAYKLLKEHFKSHPGYFTEMDSYIGTYGSDKTTSADDCPWCSDKIAGGVWAEDVDDVIYNLGEHNNLLIQDYYEQVGGPDYWEEMIVSASHFWNPDKQYYTRNDIITGDQNGPVNQGFAKILSLTGLFDNVPTAVQKARFFHNGGWNWRLAWTICHHETYSFPGVIQMYKVGNYHYKDWYSAWFWCYHWSKPDNEERDGYWPETARKAYAYNILGRMIHLVQDMGVPAHVNLEEHFLMEDYYEPAMIPDFSYASQWEANDVYQNRGSFVNPFASSHPYKTEGLMIMLAQLADYNPSRRADGNDTWVMGSYGLNPSEAKSIKNSYGPSSPWTEAQYNYFHDTDAYDADKMFQEADILIPYTIQITAGILYWFMVETGQIPTQSLTHQPFNLTLNNNSINGDYYLFRASKAFITDPDPPTESGIIDVCSTSDSYNFTIKKCARNVTFVATNRVVFNPGFLAEKGCSVHIHTNESNFSAKQYPEEYSPHPIFNRKTETDNDCKSIY